MHEPTICLCVQNDIIQPLKWMLKEYDRQFLVTSLHSAIEVEQAMNTKHWDILIFESSASQETILPYLQRLRTHTPGQKIILIVPPNIQKEEVIELIKQRMVQGLLVKPFTGEVMSSYLDKLCVS